MNRVSCRSIRVATALGLILAALATSAQAEVIQRGKVTVFKADPASQASRSTIDFVNAKPFPLPEASESAAVSAQQDLINDLVNQYQSSAPTASGHSLGRVGNGDEINPVELGAPETTGDGGIGSQQHGTFNHPFSTARADLNKPTNKRYPYRASGRLFFTIPGQGTFVCSASLIKRGLIVTAAHCIANYGASQFYTDWVFVPGYRNGVVPFGTWSWSSATVTSSYFTGAPGECSLAGIICKNDVGVIRLASQGDPNTGFPGTNTGWYGFGWDGWGFTSNGLTHITQTGYPVALDGGLLMQRNDSQGFKSASNSDNTLIGSLMTGGSSGGPWLNNFGYKPVLGGGFAFGTFSDPNIVVGTTSWGYTAPGSPKQMGASPFTSGNIVSLVNLLCGSPASDPACL